MWWAQVSGAPRGPARSPPIVPRCRSGDSEAVPVIEGIANVSAFVVLGSGEGILGTKLDPAVVVVPELDPILGVFTHHHSVCQVESELGRELRSRARPPDYDESSARRDHQASAAVIALSASWMLSPTSPAVAAQCKGTRARAPGSQRCSSRVNGSGAVPS